mmetsp:Transcript_4569/g.9131  ORF Transcript_4569/g.9131 Transcript_4569/m.9131 type:complete len:202 (-) Transcript_4569:142-747(-)
MVPSRPTLSIACVSISPNTRSPFPEMVATEQISSGEDMGCVISLSLASTLSTARSIPRLRSMGFIPAATALIPSLYIARVRTVAVVVPSPATSLVALATLRTSCAPRFMWRSLKSMFFATVTPSFVICGAPNDFSRMTFLPFGPSVTCTASANASTPRNIEFLASVPKRTSLPVAMHRRHMPLRLDRIQLAPTPRKTAAIF